MRVGAREIGLLLAALVAGGALFWWVAPYNIAASVPHAPGVSWLLHRYMAHWARTWSFGAEPPAHLNLADPALIRLGAGHFETGCAPCHGAPGRDRNPIVRGMLPEPPVLDGAGAAFRPRELYWIVRHGLKYTGMPAWAGEGRPEEPWALAAFLLAYPAGDPARYRELAFGRGEERPGGPPQAVAFGGEGGAADPAEDCARCHGRDGQGREGTAPKLAGQSLPYLSATLAAYASGARESGFMEPLAAALPAEEREALVRHYADMPAFGPGGDDPDPEAVERGRRLAEAGDEHGEIPSCLSCHGAGEEARRNPLFPRIAGQDRRWLVTWLRRWREAPLGGTAYARQMHEAARPLDDAEIEDLARFFAAGGGGADQTKARMR